MEKANTTSAEAFFNEAELKEILVSLEAETKEGLSSEEIDRVAKAWAQVEREKLFKQ